MRVEVALVELKGARLAVAFPEDPWVRPGAGDTLISRMTPYLPPLGIMLVSEGAYPRAYAAFETQEFLSLLRMQELSRFTVDLSEPPEDEDELPF